MAAASQLHGRLMVFGFSGVLVESLCLSVLFQGGRRSSQFNEISAVSSMCMLSAGPSLEPNLNCKFHGIVNAHCRS